MKKIISAAMIWGLLAASCDHLGGFFKNESAQEARDSVSLFPEGAVRDESITAENAFSDLFLDTTAVENFIRSQGLNDTLATGMRRFYNTRNYQYAWFTSDGLTEHGRYFWNWFGKDEGQGADPAKKDSLSSAGSYAAKDSSWLLQIDSLAGNDSIRITAHDSAFVRAELMLTHELVQQSLDRDDSSSRSLASFYRMIPVRKMDVMQMADSLLNGRDSVLATMNPAYAKMKEYLRRYYEAAKDSSWQPLALNGRQLKIGASAPELALLKKRLQLTGDYSGHDTAQVYNEALAKALASFRKRHGLDSTGQVNDSVLAILNVPAEQRLQQILVNMHRLSLMPQDSASRRLMVNIPSYMLYVWEGDSTVMDMPVVVGKEGTNTVMFTGALNQIVFSPYWNIPSSIVQNEILPAMKKDPNYLKKNNFERVGGTDELPQLRQLPGPDNSLGRVKFLFPNSYDIYLHDSPHKGLFEKDQRAFSHGCIRVAKAEELAAFLLRDNKDWNAGKIRQAMNAKQPQEVKLNQPVPVMISYHTVWVDEDGRLTFGDDVYGQDEKIMKHMFLQGGGSRQAAAAGQQGSDTTVSIAQKGGGKANKR